MIELVKRPLRPFVRKYFKWKAQRQPQPRRPLRLAHDALKLGAELLASKKIDEAGEVFADALHFAPKNPWLNYQMAEVHIRRGELEKALPLLERVDSDSASLMDRTAMRRAAIHLSRDEPCAGWDALHPRLRTDDESALAFFQSTFGTRIRTNSLLSEWHSADFSCEAATRRIEQRISDAISTATPFSFIRLGDGEGGVLADRRKGLIGAVDHRAGRRHLSDDERAYTRHLLREACDNADMIGLPREDMSSPDYLSAIMGLKESTRIKIAGGIIHLTDCHSHYAMHKFGAIPRLISRLPFVGFVGGRDIAGFLANHAPQAKTVHYAVPVQAGQGELAETPHYPDHFTRIMDALEVPAPGSLFLVAAGVLGKVYCHRIKQLGGVAVDVGAVADLWAGVSSSRDHMLTNGLTGSTLA